MAGLVPAIHVFCFTRKEDVDARHRRQVYAVCAKQTAMAGHDEIVNAAASRLYVSIPTIAPIRQVVSVPETIDFNPSELISSRRSGAMVPRPPIMMPRLPKLAKPHIA